MTASSFNEDINFDITKVATKLILETATSKEIRILMKAGQKMQKHQTPYPITVHLLKGSIDFGLNNNEIPLKEGDIIGLDADVPHDLSATSDSIIRLTLSKNDQIQRVEKVISLP